ncbi:TetR/AcrR family transcriptional regulator [Spongiibacter taiwanensis]|uniref:TetR/AcrR family transcriptional regulator n=1 Tax=Spongiibacter taiwanensis TaxID=1748242 RepID=UPI002036192D|nr:TetR/AcrR family transcriptional regulator [Spongiibacter taiwanensis]USA42663.1 TetR/AcrR family transcriptional regulator [Spongiibacter taiwanensis]
MQAPATTKEFEDTPLSPQRQAVIAAARDSICQRGMKKTTMLALAADMALSRQTLYRTFDNRDELLAIIYVREFDDAVSQALAPTLRDKAFAEAVADSVVLAIGLVDDNPILNDMMLGSGAPWFQSHILDRRSLLHGKLMALGKRLWQEPLAQARQKQQLNPALSDEEIVEWLLTNHYLTLVRPKETRAHHIAMLRKLVIPALLNAFE